MNSRDILLQTINHRSPGRLPVDLGSATVTGISAIAYNNLKKHLGIEKPTKVFDVVQQLANVDMEVIDLLGVDALDINRIAVEGGERKDVLKRCEIFSKDGGFVFAPIHNILSEVPPQNIMAAYGAVGEFNGSFKKVIGNR
jgi:hypothetical protein